MNLRYLTLTVTAALASSVSLLAQTTPAPSAADPTAADENIITLPQFSVQSEKDTGYVGKSALSSTRVAVDLAELPQSVKVLNSSFIKATNAFNMPDILNYTGGAQNGALNWTAGRLAIRGFSGDGDYTDSFAPPSQTVIDPTLYDRFEVIKGPSTIFLAADGSPGGLVNKITKNPQSERSTTVSVQTGLFDANHASVDTTGPITSNGKLLYRFIAGATYSNGYYDNTYMHRNVFFPALSYQVSPDTKVELKAVIVNTSWPSYNGLQTDPRTLKIWDVPYTRSSSEDSPYNWRHDHLNRIWINITSRLNEFVALRVAAMNAYDQANRQESLANTWSDGGRVWNAATSPTTYTGGAYPRTTTADNQVSRYRDLQADLNFNFKTGPANHSFLIGGEVRDNPNSTAVFAGTSSPWNPFVKTDPTVTVNWATPTSFNENISTLARVYAAETVKLFKDRLVLNYGITRTRASAGTTNRLTNVVTTPEFIVNKNLKQYGIVYKALPGVSLFYGYNENYALNGVGTVNGVPGTPLAPKQGKQSEVGIKTEFLNKRATVNISYFDVQQKNNTVPSSPFDPANPNILIPGVISRGFDGDVTFQVNRHFYLMGSFSMFDAKSVLGPAAATFIQPYTNTIITGSLPVDNISENSWSLMGLYRFTEGPLKGLSLNLGANSLDKRAITDNANQVWFGYVPGRTLVNLSATYRVNKHVNLGLNIDNLFNKKYIYSVRSVNVIVPGTPLNAKFSVDYTF